jgi:hypothetical protein
VPSTIAALGPRALIMAELAGTLIDVWGHFIPEGEGDGKSYCGRRGPDRRPKFAISTHFPDQVL